MPSYFFKPVSSLNGNGRLIRPQGAELLGVEGEIALIVGKRARFVSPSSASEHIGWLAAANDAGVADFRWNDRGSAVMSKGQDGFTPMGPAIAADTINIGTLVLSTRINGTIVQQDEAANLIFGFEFLIADLSRLMTLEPGDIILTGTPAGAGTVEPGDTVVVDLGGVSTVTSTVVASDRPLPAYGAQPKVTAEARAFAGIAESDTEAAVSEETLKVFRTVSVATLTVELARRGIRDTFMRGLRSTRPELRMVGRAHTLRYLPLREDVRDANTAELNAQKATIESLGPGEVLVIDARGEPNAGTIGDILAARAMILGAAGIVTDGGIRDSGALAELAIPTYFRSTHAAVLGLAHYPFESDVPVACGGVLVMPGDVVIGDPDGVLVIPAQLADAVATDAKEREIREQWALERVMAGESIRGVYPLSESRLAEFETWRQTRGES